MQLDQFLRRLVWRARRKVQAVADNEPIVIVEPAGRVEARPSRPHSWRLRPIGILALLALAALILAVVAGVRF